MVPATACRDGLSRIVQAAVDGDVVLSGAEFAAIRRLLKDGRTWELVGSGPVGNLAERIASRMPDRGGDKALATGWAIASGVLEFAGHAGSIPVARSNSLAFSILRSHRSRSKSFYRAANLSMRYFWLLEVNRDRVAGTAAAPAAPTR